ncbi:serine hydrolase domain-containing protein [Polyangium sp. 15x6]|uniref:serine hydrolase domain-containing protein n=1 Tax=Polyangium sp. 15x6 TaxID=3042687 RepID=UPI002499CFAA|nr:serine hydrolase domain-containing protein [Polyangium sp. 15x6]MDI3285978.1 serine hydrolase domain-containing protein [Polyangium sp. 15x6]
MFDTDDAKDRVLHELIGEVEAPGLAVAICGRNGILWHHARGHADAERSVPVDLDTPFGTGSITKTFTAAAILALRDDGILKLDEPLVESIPEAAALRYPTKDSAPITLRHLLTHTSGLPRGVRDLRGELHREPNDDELLAHLASVRMARAPGVDDEYSNLGFALLGIVVARRSGQPYASFIKERILDPLGMTTSTFAPEVLGEHLATPHKNRDGVLGPNRLWEHAAYTPVGGLYASTRDVIRWISFQLAAWPPRDDPDPARPLRRATVRESHRVGGLHRIGRRGKGLGWSIKADSPLGEIVWHNGGLPMGYAAFCAFEPTVGVGLVALTNALVDMDDRMFKTLAKYAVSRGLVEDRRR